MATIKKTSKPKTVRAPKKTSKVKDVAVIETMPEQVTPMYKDKKLIAIVLGVVTVGVIAFALPFFRSLLFAASVNGTPISRTAVVTILEKQSGKQALDTLVSKELILQDIKKKGIVVEEKDVDAEVKKIEDGLKKANQTLSDALKAQNMTEKDLREELRYQLILKKVLSKKMEVSKKEVSDYIEQNKDSIPETVSGEALNTQVKDQLQNQKFSTEVQTYLNELRTKAKISYYTSY